MTSEVQNYAVNCWDRLNWCVSNCVSSCRLHWIILWHFLITIALCRLWDICCVCAYFI